MYICN